MTKSNIVKRPKPIKGSTKPGGKPPLNEGPTKPGGKPPQTNGPGGKPIKR